jgi:hypothetical protein
MDEAVTTAEPTFTERLEAQKLAVAEVIAANKAVIESGDQQLTPRAERDLTIAEAVLFMLNDTTT